MHSCDSGSSLECQWLVSTTAACPSRPSQHAVLPPTPLPASLSSCCPLQWRFAEIMYRRAPSSSRSSSTPSTPDADVERVVLFVVDPWAVAAPNPASVSALSAAQQAAAGARGTETEQGYGFLYVIMAAPSYMEFCASQCFLLFLLEPLDTWLRALYRRQRQGQR